MLEATDTTHEDFQAVYSSMFELIVEPLQMERKQDAHNHGAEDSGGGTDPRPPKRRKLDDGEYASNIKVGIQGTEVEAKKVERSVLNKVLDRSKISSCSPSR